MNKRVNHSLIIASFFVLLFLASDVSAQTATTTTVGDTVTTSSQQNVDEVLNELKTSEESLSDLKIKEPGKVIGGLGLWWRNLRENIVLALTMDPMKKAEKQLVYAEERIKMAEKIIAESDSLKSEALAQKVIERANEYIKKIEEKKDKWLAKDAELGNKLKANLIAHQVRRDEAVSKIEDKLKGDAADKMGALREKLLVESERVLTALDNSNMPAEIREQLNNVRDRIEQHTEAVKQYREQKQEILKDTVNKDETNQKLEDLWKQRKAEMENIRLDYKVKKDDLVDKIIEGNKEAEEKLKAIEHIREDFKKRQETITERLKKLLEMKKEGMSEQERLKKLDELRKEDAEFEQEYEDENENEDEDKNEDRTATTTAESNDARVRGLQRAKALQERARENRDAVNKELNEQ